MVVVLMCESPQKHDLLTTFTTRECTLTFNAARINASVNYMALSSIYRLFAHADSTRTVATSDLCTNATAARIADVIWSSDSGRQQGVALTPKQILCLEPWIEFPAAPSLVPINVTGQASPAAAAAAAGAEPVLYVLLETQVEPVRQKENNVLRVSVQVVY